MTTHTPLKELRRRVRAAKSAANAARELGITPQAVSLILKGRRKIGPKVAEALGFKLRLDDVPGP